MPKKKDTPIENEIREETTETVAPVTDEQGQLSIHTENIFPIIKKWLYSEHDIFLRELVANATDAMAKRQALQPDLSEDDLYIELKVDDKAHTLQIIDQGIGMTAEEIKKYINQIAFSGAEDFINKYKEQQNNIIGHFGLGFYSVFMVAQKVTIDSLSYQNDAKAAYWECDGSTSYAMGPGARTTPGTTITIYLNDEGHGYADTYKIRDLVEKYCNFMPYPIRIDDEDVNLQEPLWNKKPVGITDDEYKEFYRKMFHDWEDPLFWIHLNVDFPFTLKGILYFPKIKSQLDWQRGSVKLYCHNVFVADNLKEFIPEFMFLLRGGIDVPDIPLNVSRSFLQNDDQVKKISGYIIKKIADSLNDVFTGDRAKFEGFWPDIDQFVKYGVLTSDKFAESMKDVLIFKSSNGDWVNVDEYAKRNPTQDNPLKLYYTASENMQVSQLKIMKDAGKEVLFAGGVLDTHIIQHLENRKPGEYQFVRIDSEINDHLVNKEKSEELFNQNREEYEEEEERTVEKEVEKDGKKEKVKEKVRELVKKVRDKRAFALEQLLEDKNVIIKVQSLATADLPGMIVFEEQLRRFQEMNSFAKQKEFDLLARHTWLVNAENPAVQRIFDLQKQGNNEQAALMASYVHDLAVLEQKQFTGDELAQFVGKAVKVLNLV